MLHCKNCSKEFEGNYCPNCGQLYIDKRFTLKESIFWVFHSIFNFDKGFLYTSKEMVLRPGVVINEFINGITIRYAHPFRFIFIWATISAIIGVWAGSIEDTGIAVNEVMGTGVKGADKNKEIFAWMKQYMSFIIMLMLPFLATATFLLFKSKRLNYAEHLIVMAYGQSGSIIIGLPLMFLYHFYPNIGIMGFINFSVGAFVYSRTFVKTFKVGWFEAFLKYLLVLLIGVTCMMITLMIFIIIYILIIKFFGFENPFKPVQ